MGHGAPPVGRLSSRSGRSCTPHTARKSSAAHAAPHGTWAAHAAYKASCALEVPAHGSAAIGASLEASLKASRNPTPASAGATGPSAVGAPAVPGLWLPSLLLPGRGPPCLLPGVLPVAASAAVPAASGQTGRGTAAIRAARAAFASPQAKAASPKAAASSVRKCKSVRLRRGTGTLASA